jgi:PBSX family phage terminase large subunit
MNLIEPFRPLFVKNPSNRYFVVTGGRASAKSFHVATACLNYTYLPNQVILYSRYTLTSAHISIIPEFLEKIELLGSHDDFDITLTEIVNRKTGSRIVFRGIKNSSGNQTANLKSIQGVTVFLLDEAEELTDYDTFEKIDLSIRTKGIPNRVILVMNPSYKTHWVYERYIAPNRSDTVVIHTTYLDNKANLSESFLEQAERTRTTNPIRYSHVFLGQWLDDADGIMWNRGIIERQRIQTKPEQMRVVIAVDPATTKTMQSDETGIIVAGEANGHGYVLDDLSGKYSPDEWATVVSKAVEQYDAVCIVAEKNQGGDMVESVLRQRDRTTRIKLVTATKGKAVRAEPIYSLYEQGRIWHVGNHPKLEQQMVTFNPDSGSSPDRVDALVWAFTDLIQGKKRQFFVT